MRKLFLAILCLIALTQTVEAAPRVLKVWGGVNAVWYDNSVKPTDTEVGLFAAASLSKHISVVGSGVTGLDNQYVAASVGPRLTVSDVDSTGAYSAALGVEHQFSNKQEYRPNEWCAKATVGFRPWIDLPQIVLGFQTSYGMESNTFAYVAAARYEIGRKK